MALTAFCASQTALTAQDALALAAKNRPALAAAKLSVVQARTTARALGAHEPTTLGIGASNPKDIGATDGDLYLSQPIDLFGRTSANRKAGEAGIQLALSEYRATAQELQNEVLTAFTEAVAASHKKEVSVELLKISEELFVATKRRFEEGKVAEVQVARASIETARAKQSADLVESDLQASLKRLAALLGQRAVEVAVEADATIAPVLSPDLDSRSDLLALRVQVQTAEADAAIARASNRPELALQLVRTPWGTSDAFGGRAQLTWPILDHGKARHEGRAARQRAEAARRRLQDASEIATSELEATQIEIAARQNRVRSYEAILASARDLVAKSQKGYAEGFGTQIDVLEATRALREVENDLVEARQQLSLSVIAQYRASGFLSEVLQ